MLPHDISELMNSGITLPESLPPGTPVIIYGAGNMGREIAQLLRGQGHEVISLLDQKARPGSSWEDIPVRLPDSSEIPRTHRANVQVVLGIFNRDAEVPSIITNLRALGYEHVTTFFDFYQSNALLLGERYWLTTRAEYQGHQASAAAPLELFLDETSRALYLAILRFRLTGDYACLPAPSPRDQYFPTDLPRWNSPLRMIDCGAYDGDTLRALAGKNLPLAALAAFEPDPTNFAKLAQAARIPSLASTEICLYPCGVSDQTKQLRFDLGQGESSGASEKGGTTIQCVALDDALPSFRPTLIKMDIEGAERDALHGARQTIVKYRPGLAICVYHRASDLWTIPNLIGGWLRGGQHYLRAHGHSSFELVYYWMP